jgi:hypothetical protein
MFYALLLLAALNTCHSADVPDGGKSIGSIIVFRGDDVSIYSGGKKTKLEEKKMPYTVYSGDEIGTSVTSDCEILLNSDDTLYVAPESLVGVELFKTTSSTISLRYGVIMFKGDTPVKIQSKDFLTHTSGGDFLMKYKRSAFETTLFNFGPNLKVKRDMDKKYMNLPNKSYARLASFKEGKKIGKIKDGSISVIYDVFRISYKPAGNAAVQANVPGDSGGSGKKLPYTKTVNLDMIKRTIGL